MLLAIRRFSTKITSPGIKAQRLAGCTADTAISASASMMGTHRAWDEMKHSLIAVVQGEPPRKFKVVEKIFFLSMKIRQVMEKIFVYQ